ncbi:hypothetical protein L7F22_027375 [Adiantum nelumboides]|nr:hypothetical protein [Adiantum nelumboides]
MAVRRSILRGVVFNLEGTLRVPPSLDLQALRQAISKDADHRSPEQKAKALQAIDSAVDAQHQQQQQLGGSGAILGAKEVCDFIDARGLLRALITSSSEDDMQRFLQLAELNNCSQQFNPMIGKEYSSLKPFPDPLLHVFKQWGAKPWHVLMVGDTPAYDVACGNAVGSLTCLVDPLFQYKNDTLPRQHRPTFKIHSLQELMCLIQRLQ